MTVTYPTITNYWSASILATSAHSASVRNHIVSYMSIKVNHPSIFLSLLSCVTQHNRETHFSLIFSLDWTRNKIALDKAMHRTPDGHFKCSTPKQNVTSIYFFLIVQLLIQACNIVRNFDWVQDEFQNQELEAIQFTSSRLPSLELSCIKECLYWLQPYI